MKKSPHKVTIDKKSWLYKKRALDICEDINKNIKGNKEKAYSFLNDLLKESQTNQKVAISWLLKKKAFSKLEAQKIFELAIECLKTRNDKMFEEILKAVKIQNPLREDLGFYITEKGDTLGHLAAKTDNPSIIMSLYKLNPEYLRVKNSDGDTVPHIASKFLSQKAIEVMVSKYPGLFWVRNNKGLKPTDLEGGPIIRSMITESKIHQAWEMDNNTYLKSLQKLQQASGKNPVKKETTLELSIGGQR